MNFDFIDASIRAQIALGIAVIALLLALHVFGVFRKDTHKKDRSH